MFICLFVSSSSAPYAFRADKLQLVVLGELGISRLQGIDCLPGFVYMCLH